MKIYKKLVLKCINLKLEHAQKGFSGSDRLGRLKYNRVSVICDFHEFNPLFCYLLGTTKKGIPIVNQNVNYRRKPTHVLMGITATEATKFHKDVSVLNRDKSDFIIAVPIKMHWYRIPIAEDENGNKIRT